MKIILSIKPQFADKIFDGTKKFEFRRLIYKDPRVKTIIVYASSPIRKVIGEFEVEEVHYMKVGSLWRKTKDGAGITKDFFEAYFEGKEQGYAITVGKTKRYRRPLHLHDHYGMKPPQSFAYLRT